MPTQPRSRRDVLRLLGGAAAAGALGASGAANAQDRPWNVLLLVSDEHSPRLPAPGGTPWLETPNLARLASEGVTLTRAYATSPICAPARMGLLAGKHPAETAVLSNGHSFDPANRTIAHVFGEAGYQTACVGKTHVNRSTSSYGFDTWLSKESDAFKMLLRARKEGTEPLPVPEAERALWEGIADRRLRGAPIAAPWTPISAVVMDVMRLWLGEPPTRPFFYYGSWTEPHWVWNLPSDVYGRYDPAAIPLPSAGPPTLARVPEENRQRYGWAAMSEAQHRLCLARYAAAITYTDRVLGVILDLLDQSGQADRTIVVYTSDHGDMAAQKRLWLKGLMYDASCGIPMIVRMPGVLPAGTTCPALMSGADLLPTLAGLAGLPPPADLSGRDLSAALRGEDPGPEHLFATLGGRPNNKLPPQIMVRDQRYKLIRYKADPDLGRPELRELYDMDEDPDEDHDLSDTLLGRARAERMSRLGDAWLLTLRPSPFPLQHGEKAPKGDAGDPNADVEDDD